MFRDRKDGGEQLGEALKKYRNQDVLVLGIPRGGVETAYYVARHLNAELSFVVTRKLGYPFNPEAAFGALAEDGSLFFDDITNGLSQEAIQAVVDKERMEIERRISILRKNKPLQPMEGRTVIIVDDGIATGATIFATVQLCKKKKATKIVVAAPVGAAQIERILEGMVDEVVILNKPQFYNAVSQGYYSFHNLADHQVLEILDRWERDTHVRPSQ
jgi:predicted phosphoribosyltransferase